MIIRIRGSLWGGPPGPRPAPWPAPSTPALSDPRFGDFGPQSQLPGERGTDAFVCQPGDLGACSPDTLSTRGPLLPPEPAPSAHLSRPFSLSLCIHGAIVGVLALSSSTQSAAPRSL